MIHALTFTNWRSLRQAKLELTPINTVIGANSSGKTNIVDALRFIRYLNIDNLMDIWEIIPYEWGAWELQITSNREYPLTELTFECSISPLLPERIKYQMQVQAWPELYVPRLHVFHKICYLFYLTTKNATHVGWHFTVCAWRDSNPRPSAP